jgi:hypothetical protein
MRKSIAGRLETFGRLTASVLLIAVLLFPLAVTQQAQQERQKQPSATQQERGTDSTQINSVQQSFTEHKLSTSRSKRGRRGAATTTQRQPFHEGKMRRKTLEGVVIRKNVATLKPGYEFVNQSKGVLAVMKKKAKKKKLTGSVQTGTLKCGCIASDLSICALQQDSPTQAGCYGDCQGGCDFMVTVQPVGPK